MISLLLFLPFLAISFLPFHVAPTATGASWAGGKSVFTSPSPHPNSKPEYPSSSFERQITCSVDRRNPSSSHDMRLNSMVHQYHDFSQLFDQAQHGLRKTSQRSTTLSLACILFSHERSTPRSLFFFFDPFHPPGFSFICQPTHLPQLAKLQSWCLHKNSIVLMLLLLCTWLETSVVYACQQNCINRGRTEYLRILTNRLTRSTTRRNPYNLYSTHGEVVVAVVVRNSFLTHFSSSFWKSYLCAIAPSYCAWTGNKARTARSSIAVALLLIYTTFGSYCDMMSATIVARYKYSSVKLEHIGGHG